MAEVNTSDRSSLSCRVLFRTAFLAFLCATSLLAQKTPEPSLPKYDLHTESKMKGTVEEVENTFQGQRERNCPPIAENRNRNRRCIPVAA